MVKRMLLSLLLCVSCGGAGPEFRGLPATRIAVDGSVFLVRVKDSKAEAIRINSQYAPRVGPIHDRAAFAMEKVSGCKVRDVRGDQVLVVGKLSCDAHSQDRARWPKGVSYDCIQLATGVKNASGVPYADYDCDPY